MRKFIYTVMFAIAISALCHPLHAATTRANDVKVLFYDKWQTLPDDSLIKMGDRYMDREMYDSTLVCYSVVANRYYEHEKLTDRQADKCILAMNRLGYLYYFYLYDYQKAYGYLHLAEKLSYKYDNKRHLPYILRDIAGIFQNYSVLSSGEEEEEDELSSYGRAFNAAHSIKDWNALVSVFINMLDNATTPESMNRIGASVEIFKSLKPYEEDIELYKYADMLYEGNLAIFDKDYEKALRLYTEMENQISSSAQSSLRYHLQSISKRSMAYFMMGKDDKAVSEINKLESLAGRHNLIDVQVNIYEALSRYYKDHGDNERSMHYRMLYLNAKDSILTQHNLIKVKEMKFLNELDSINEEMRQLAYKRKMERNITIAVSVIAVLLLVIVMILIYSYRRLKAKNKSIYQRSVEALEAERKMRELYEQAKDKTEPANTEQKDSDEVKYKGSDLDESEKKEIAGRIRFIMDNSDEIFQEGFSIDQLASLANIKKRHVSQVINEQFGMPFTTLLCDYRIKEACRRINDKEKYGKFTIGAIALGVGFKSQSNFVGNFKRIMGLTPSEYQRQSKL